MLKRSYRLPAKTKLTNALFFKTPFFSVRMAQNGLPQSRFGFVISKKTAKTAVDRNASKRKVRACIEQRLEMIQTGYDVLFILQKNLRESSALSVCQEIENLLQTKGLLAK